MNDYVRMSRKLVQERSKTCVCGPPWSTLELWTMALESGHAKK
jgi:hypothetical protein